ncbi:hypothetical protein BO83DRAFT_100050 [Aspergillus eucalypticola CBS 122712]|uniref:Uncharacterized protein n=1 Tax=Aspergillus eucalypticola (strain CBS 122712 / IBT 29274) TaxID=1448314 RepID=A0A317V5G0_ASPEC|nr:uncharacterized protein BO83DRAFT_100050 [Aspergillus eucalypticola CBS 122712]PWY67430.1 hypothetical protein BO83DRAFT_100050 [Aspergillus eucalypticola CBS 122712]
MKVNMPQIYCICTSNPPKLTLPYTTYKKNRQERKASFCCKADCMYLKTSLSALFSHLFLPFQARQTDSHTPFVALFFHSFILITFSSFSLFGVRWVRSS